MTRGVEQRLIVEADGGSRGNPGVAGYGALVRDTDGTVLRELAAPLGQASNNVAEYSGLIAGLRAAALIVSERGEEQITSIEVRMDSKLVVEQMSGRWKIKHADMQRLAQDARAVVGDLRSIGCSVSFQWIPRGENRAADALSNHGMDGEHIDRAPGSDDAGVDRQGDDPKATGGEGGTADEELLPGVGRLTGALGSEVAEDVREQSSPDMAPPVRVVLVRHGVTDYTAQARLDGRDGADPALSAEGMAQAKAAARGLQAFLGEAPGVTVVTSSLQRARQTGQMLVGALTGATLSAERELDELNFGDWEGRTLAEISSEDPEIVSRVRNTPDEAIPGGESYDQLGARVRPVFARLVEQARETAPGDAAPTLVVVAHRGPIGVILADVLGLDLPHVWRLAISPCSLTSIRLWRDGGVSVEFVNDTSHHR